MKYYKWFGKFPRGGVINNELDRVIKSGGAVIEMPDNETAGACVDYGWIEISNAELLIEIYNKTPMFSRSSSPFGNGPWRRRKKL